MSSIDYVNSLIKERDELKQICKSHLETIRMMKRELLKKDKRLSKLEKEQNNTKLEKELNRIKADFETLNLKYNDLQQQYNEVVCENEEFKMIFYEIDNMSDSDYDN